MILALMLAAAEPQTAIDAERAFAADAQKLGQWTAFRKYAADDAVMFVPQADSAHKFLKDKADPPVAVFWWPGRSYVSCDGSYAVNTGTWVRQWSKSVGYFTTIWRRQPDGSWKWLLDHGDELPIPRAEGGDIKPVVASCNRPNPPPLHVAGSSDWTLTWQVNVQPDGSRGIHVFVWNGTEYEKVVDDIVKALPK